MLALHRRPKGIIAFGLSILTFHLMPSAIGEQDLAGPVTRSLELSSRARASTAVSTFGTIHEAKFKLPQPVGTTIPQPVGLTLASVDARDLDPAGAGRGQERLEFPAIRELDFPTVERRLKGDMLAARPRPEQEPEPDEKIVDARPVVRLPPEPDVDAESPIVLAVRPPLSPAAPRAADPPTFRVVEPGRRRRRPPHRAPPTPRSPGGVGVAAARSVQG